VTLNFINCVARVGVVAHSHCLCPSCRAANQFLLRFSLRVSLIVMATRPSKDNKAQFDHAASVTSHRSPLTFCSHRYLTRPPEFQATIGALPHQPANRAPNLQFLQAQPLWKHNTTQKTCTVCARMHKLHFQAYMLDLPSVQWLSTATWSLHLSHSPLPAPASLLYSQTERENQLWFAAASCTALNWPPSRAGRKPLTLHHMTA